MNNISFIVPAFNCEKTIVESLDSIRNGNFEIGDEIIVVNDCSTDGTLKTVEAYQKQYPELTLKIIDRKINKGTASAARNTAIEQASHEIFFCLDSDNLLVPKSIPQLKNFLLTNRADAAAFGEIHFFTEETGQRVFTHKWVFKDGQLTINDALSGHYWPGPSGNYMFTKYSWFRAGKYFEPTIFNQTLDSWAFGIWQLASGQKFLTLKDGFYQHRYGINSHYVRENKKTNVSASAAAILSPYWRMIKDRDLEYLLSKKYRYSWYERLEKRAIEFKDLPSRGLPGKMVKLI